MAATDWSLIALYQILYETERSLIESKRPANEMTAAASSISPSYVAVERPAINPWVIAVTVTLATFMELLDTAIANVALPHIAGGLAVSYDESTWVLTSYLVSNAVVLPLSAWLSRVFGRKRYYMICVMLFTLSSMLCGLAPSPRPANLLPRPARRRRRWPRSGRAGDPRGHVPCPKTRGGICALQHGHRHCSCDRASARWMDHRQLELALDFFHQYPDRDHIADPDQEG